MSEKIGILLNGEGDFITILQASTRVPAGCFTKSVTQEELQLLQGGAQMLASGQLINLPNNKGAEQVSCVVDDEPEESSGTGCDGREMDKLQFVSDLNGKRR